MRPHAPVLLALLLPACRGCSTESAGAAGAAAPASAPAPAPSAASPARRLAMQPPGGSAPVDRRIEQNQALLVKLPSKSDAWVTLGRAWIQKARETADPGFYLNADACADEVLALDPRNALGLGLKAQVALNDHRFSDAHDLAQRSLAAAPEDLVALGADSDALLELGRFEEAAAAAQRLIDLKPSLSSYVRTSYFRWLQGDIPGALLAARSAASSGRSAADPEPLAWALVQAAMIFWHKGDYEGSLAGFDKALEAMADYPPALAGRGRALLSLGRAREAVGPLEQSYRRSPLVETAWLLGDAREAAGDEAGAQAARAQVVERGRLHDPRTLALFLATHERDADEAVRLARREKERRGDIYTDDALGWALHRAGKLDEARQSLDRATRLGTPDASLLFHLGAVKLAQGDRAGGEKLLRQALATNPHFDLHGAAEAQRLLGPAKR